MDAHIREIQYVLIIALGCIRANPAAQFERGDHPMLFLRGMVHVRVSTHVPHEERSQGLPLALPLS